MVKKVRITREVAGLLLAMSREVYPREMITTMHGSYKQGVVTVREVYLIPGSIYGEGFSSFNPYVMPFDVSFMGVAHSHPSGVGMPSGEDLTHMMGRVMVIVTAPYRDERDIHAFNSKGEKLEVEIIDED